MTNYTTDDFSEIHGPDENPTVPGWYICSSFLPDVEEIRKSPKELKNKSNFGRWYGSEWHYYEGDECIIQYRYWFGLKEKP